MERERAPTTLLDEIPTISAAVANMPPPPASCRPNGSASGGRGDEAAVAAAAEASTQLTLEIVQQKFKDFEKVHSIFEAYEIRGQEHITRLLALVSSVPGGTYAIIAFAWARTDYPSSIDLTTNKVFPLNESFQLLLDGKGPSLLQFALCTGDERPTKYYYYPLKTMDATVNFQDFQAQIISCKNLTINRELQPDALLSFGWLNDYRQIGEVKHELKKRESEYIVYKDIKIYCATWNVNDTPYSDSPLSKWLSCCKETPDIYAIGLQEFDNSKLSTVMREHRPDALWVKKMLESVHQGCQYEELKTVRLSGMMLTVLVRRQLRPHISRCRDKSVACGFLNTLGNKGGVAVSLQLNEGNICFVNSHLAAHLPCVEERNDNYRLIVQNMVFNDDVRRKINDHDHIFWIGDLNYRLQKPTLWAGGDPDDYDSLMQFDQLVQERRKGKCFVDYMEGEIKFKPTYKYDPGTDNYDSSEKQRAPAYCDRVLWKGSRIEQLDYNSVMEIRQSDHKPVYAVFNIKIKTRDEQKYKRVQEEVLKAVDKRENDNQPQISVDKTVIDFGRVRFNEMAIMDLKVANSCRMSVKYLFKVKDPPLNDICEKWLQVSPSKGELQIESVDTIRVKLLADVSSIAGLLKKIRTSYSNSKFDFDILILHVDSGPDIFITVTGEYLPSCFGLSMETMCRTNKPICEYTQEEIKQMMNDDTPEYRVTMPREFFLLIDYLHKQGSKLEGAFREMDYRMSRTNKQFNAVRDWLDSWSDDEFPGDAHCAAEALVMLLDLPEQPLLEPFVEELMFSRSKAKAMEYIDLLSAPRRNVFMHLCMFLREGIECRYYDLQQVAPMFGCLLLRSPTCDKARCTAFMERFISSETMEHVPMAGQADGGAQ